MLLTAAKGSFPKDRWPLYGRLSPLEGKGPRDAAGLFGGFLRGPAGLVFVWRSVSEFFGCDPGAPFPVM